MLRDLMFLLGAGALASSSGCLWLTHVSHLVPTVILEAGVFIIVPASSQGEN